MNKNSFIFFTLAALGKGLSGSDRIFIELARQWSRKYPIEIFLWTEGYDMCRRQVLGGKNVHYKVSSIRPWKDFGFVINYFARIIEGIRLGLTLNIKNNSLSKKQKTVNHRLYLYSASDFWMDVFPCVILKLRYPKIKWVASWYQTAPNPLRGYQEAIISNQKTINNKNIRKERYNLSALFYWLSQLPIKPLINKYADFVIVNNENERQQFTEMDKKGKVVVLLGAVPLDKINKFKKQKTVNNNQKNYDAVFQGRFHPQKGVVELIDIWRKVVDKIPNAKLAMIGDGPLRKNVESRIMNYGLENNIKLFGYLFDGREKYKIFSQSKIVVHPSFYDSGGMAAAEAMAFGLPCVGFDLISYRSYYPKGMLKVKRGDINAFSNEIAELLRDDKLREKFGKEATEMIKSNWSWNKRAEDVLNGIVQDRKTYNKVFNKKIKNN